MALPTPADVKALPFSPALAALFAAVPDDKVQPLIDSAAKLFGSAEVKQHTQRDEAVLLAAGHMLYVALAAERGGLGGGGGGLAPVSGRTLQGVGSISYAVSALDPEQAADWLLQYSPWLSRLRAILDTFPPGIATTRGSYC